MLTNFLYCNILCFISFKQMEQEEIYENENIPYVVHAHSEGIMTSDIYKKYIIPVMESASSYMAVNNNIKEIYSD